jgi:hypothetical protein
MSKKCTFFVIYNPAGRDDFKDSKNNASRNISLFLLSS